MCFIDFSTLSGAATSQIEGKETNELTLCRKTTFCAEARIRICSSKTCLLLLKHKKIGTHIFRSACFHSMVPVPLFFGQLVSIQLYKKGYLFIGKFSHVWKTKMAILFGKHNDFVNRRKRLPQNTVLRSHVFNLIIQFWHQCENVFFLLQHGNCKG